MLGTLAPNVTYARLSSSRLSEASYAATVAGLGYSLAATQEGFTLSAAGFSHKLPALTQRVCTALAVTLGGAIDASLFERAKQKLSLNLANHGHVVADRACEARLELISEPHFTGPTQLSALRALTLRDLEDYVAREWPLGGSSGGGDDGDGGGPRFCLRAFASGNLSTDEALGFYADARTALNLLPEAACTDAAKAPSLDRPLKRLDGCCVLPPDGTPGCYRVASTNESETNSALEIYWQVGPKTCGLAARVDLLVHLMFEPLFDQLRTKEQLGYSVACGGRDTGGMMGFAITITSAVATPRKLEARTHRFVGRFVSWLARMPASTFRANVEAAVANKLRDDVNLADESTRALHEIQTEQYIFDRAAREAAEMRALSHAELLAWSRALLLKSRRRLSVHAHNGAHAHAPGSVEKLPPGMVAVKDAAEFRSTLELHRGELMPLGCMGAPMSASNGQ